MYCRSTLFLPKQRGAFRWGQAEWEICTDIFPKPGASAAGGRQVTQCHGRPGEGLGWSRGQWVLSSGQPLVQGVEWALSSAAAAPGLCGSGRAAWLPMMLLRLSSGILFIPVPPGTQGALSQLSGWREQLLSHFPHKALSRYTLDQQDNAGEISIICQMNWTLWFQTTPGCREMHSQGKSIHFPVCFSF